MATLVEPGEQRRSDPQLLRGVGDLGIAERLGLGPGDEMSSKSPRRELVEDLEIGAGGEVAQVLGDPTVKRARRSSRTGRSLTATSRPRRCSAAALASTSSRATWVRGIVPVARPRRRSCA